MLFTASIFIATAARYFSTRLHGMSLIPELIETVRRIKHPMPKVWIEAYGCSASIADSEMISGLLKQGGFEIAKNEKEGSAAIIVTCSVKDRTEKKKIKPKKKKKQNKNTFL